MKLLFVLLVSSILNICGTVPTPSARTQVLYRDGCVNHPCNDEYRMTHYFDSPKDTWYDENGRVWTYDGDTWTKLK